MARKIIKLAGGLYSKLKMLSGAEALQEREVIVTTDTKELYVGASDGSFSLVNGVLFGDTLNNIQEYDPEKGRFFFNLEKGNLYIGTGTGWNLIGIVLKNLGGLVKDSNSGEISVNVDGVSIIINENGELTIGNTDYGLF